jgi:ATP-dependent HslUV protease ATP-binding subunit HslU
VEKVKARAESAAEERVLDALLPGVAGWTGDESGEEESPTRQKFRQKLRNGDLDDKDIDIEMSAAQVGVEIMAPPGMEEMSSQLQSMFQNLHANRTKTRKLKVRDALKALQEEEADKMINDEDLKLRAVEAVEQNGIVFIDEFDKICKRGEHGGPDVSREGVQRDLLPLVEGCTVSTKYGMVKTDHILFIASGAFHLSKPSDLIPEMQGRFPIRVELSALEAADFVRILTEPYASLTEQYMALLETEGVKLEFIEAGIARIAEISWEVNERTENIGARRLHTVLERLLEAISYEAPDRAGETVTVDAGYVNQQLGEIAQDEDLSRYIL